MDREFSLGAQGQAEACLQSGRGRGRVRSGATPACCVCRALLCNLGSPRTIRLWFVGSRKSAGVDVQSCCSRYKGVRFTSHIALTASRGKILDVV